MVFTDNSNNSFAAVDVFQQFESVVTDNALANTLPLPDNSAIGSTYHLRFEAEDMALDNYFTETVDFASGGQVARLGKSKTGGVSIDFSGPAGQYDIVLGYFDETDGTSRLDPLLNGQSLGGFELNKKLGSHLPKPQTFVQRVIGNGVSLESGDVLTVLGARDGSEYTRIDYIDFVASDVAADTVNNALLLPEPVRINVGGDEYIDREGRFWLADQFYNGGTDKIQPVSIAETLDDTLYQSKRYGQQLSYHVPVANGVYDVDLLFAETYWRGDGRRQFNVEIEGNQLSRNVDVHASSDFKQAFRKQYESVVVTDGILNIQLDGVKKYAHLSGIEVLAQALLPVPVPPVVTPVVVEQVVDIAAQPETIRINAGGEDYTDSLGQQWLADSFVTQGTTDTTTTGILDTNEDGLYQSARYGRNLNYRVGVADGTYNVNFLFSENSAVDSGDRLFNIDIEGETVSPGTDVAESVGRNQAFRAEFEAITVTDGVLDLQLTGLNNLAQVSGIEILPTALVTTENPSGPGTPPLSPFTDDDSSPAVTLTPDGNTVRFVSPQGTGDGSNWAQAAKLTDLDGLIEQSNPGDEIWIAGDLGEYNLGSDVVVIDSGSSALDDIYIRGVASKAGGNDTPVILSDRAENWAPGETNGSDVFRLLNGADHLHFSNLDFRNVGNGAFRLGGDLAGITLEDMRATNVRRFVENYVSGDATTASVTDLTIRDVEVNGFSKGVIRLQYNSNNVLIEDVVGDSQRQDGDNFAMGVHLGGTVNNVVHRRVTMNNATQVRDAESYWNADGFVSEADTYDLTYEDTFASGNTDGGYDLKSDGTVLIRARAADNKRNFRIWGEATMIDVVSDEPYLRGGIGTTAHIHVLSEGSDVVIEGGTFTGDEGVENIIFDLDEYGKVTVKSAVITDNDYVLQTLEEGSNLSLENVLEK